MQPYPGPGFRQQVTSRGNYPVWRKDGREIVYLDDIPGPELHLVGSRRRFGSGVPGGYSRRRYFLRVFPRPRSRDLNFLAVSRDGSRFYIPQAVEQPESDVIHVRMGWAK